MFIAVYKHMTFPCHCLLCRPEQNWAGICSPSQGSLESGKACRPLHLGRAIIPCIARLWSIFAPDSLGQRVFIIGGGLWGPVQDADCWPGDRCASVLQLKLPQELMQRLCGGCHAVNVDAFANKLQRRGRMIKIIQRALGI